jgi:CheY-like chemotaxis protein
VTTDDTAALRARIRELEQLCADVYVAAVELGLPHALLLRLWTVAAHGSTPLAYDLDLPPRPEPAQAAVSPAGTPSTPPTLPDVRITDQPRAGAVADRRLAIPELKPLTERRVLLIVDDDPMMVNVLVRILERENYELLTAANGQAALRLLESHAGPLDLLVTDYTMPDIDGRQLADRVRQRFPGIHVLYQTGFSDRLFEDRLELEDHAAFLEKPFTARGLREAVRMLLFGTLNP